MRIDSIKRRLKQRAAMLAKIREFFMDKNVLEVDTPHLGATTSPDPQILSIKVGNQYLQPSPEFYLKRLLAVASGDIYQLSHVFRDDAVGKLHTKEFMLLEWYRIGLNMHELMREVEDLIKVFIPEIKVRIISYKRAFTQYAGIDDVHTENSDQLESIWREHNPQASAPKNMSRDDWLDLLMLDLIEPNLHGAAFIHSYPVNKAALAKVEQDVAQRFELYINSVEIANGFSELNNSTEQRDRFLSENKRRKQLEFEEIPLDEDFLSALDYMPDCSGVALGVDRLLMLSLGLDNIQDVNFFN